MPRVQTIHPLAHLSSQLGMAIVNNDYDTVKQLIVHPYISYFINVPFNGTFPLLFEPATDSFSSPPSRSYIPTTTQSSAQFFLVTLTLFCSKKSPDPVLPFLFLSLENPLVIRFANFFFVFRKNTFIYSSLYGASNFDDRIIKYKRN